MSLFDALCHAFGTMATGGFSTKNGSIAAYSSAYIEWVVIIFMIFAGTNFLIHYRILFAKDLSMIRSNREFHFYLGTILAATLFCIIILSVQGILPANQVGASSGRTNSPKNSVNRNCKRERTNCIPGRSDSPLPVPGSVNHHHHRIYKR